MNTIHDFTEPEGNSAVQATLGAYVERTVESAPALSRSQSERLRAVLGHQVVGPGYASATSPAPSEPRVDIRFVARVTDALNACAVCGVLPQMHVAFDHRHESLKMADVPNVLLAIVRGMK